MTIEVATYINTLNGSLPTGLDAKGEGDDHIRLVKTVLKATFPNIAGAANPSHTELNALVGLTGTVVGTTNSQTLTNKTITAPTITAPTITSLGTVSIPTTTAFTEGIRLEGGGVSTGNVSDAISFSAANVNAAIWSSRLSSFGGRLYLATQATGGGTPVANVTIDETGQVGIGATPTATLDVVKGGGSPSVTIRAAAALVANIDLAGNGTSVGTTSFTLQQDASGVAYVYQRNNAALNLGTNNTTRLQITAAGVIQDGAGNELGYKGLPAASVTTGAFVATDKGKCVFATGGVTVPNSTMSGGDVVVIQETSGSPQTITASITTLRQTGTTNTGSRTLKAYGRAAILFQSGTLAFISGDVS